MTEDKILNKIRNLFALAGNNPSEHEAAAAALKAQELMAKYHIDMAQVDGIDKIEFFNAVYKNSDKHEMKKWKLMLAPIIAKNFCCKVYASGKSIVFFGYKKDAEIAREVFGFLYSAGNKGAVRCYNSCRKDGKSTKGVMNTYLMGFADGIRKEFEKQCTALMVITPKEVETEYATMSADWKSKKCTVKVGSDYAAYSQGVADGKDAIRSKRLENKN